jgi:hypothetical protein
MHILPFDSRPPFDTSAILALLETPLKQDNLCKALSNLLKPDFGAIKKLN